MKGPADTDLIRAHSSRLGRNECDHISWGTGHICFETLVPGELYGPALRLFAPWPSQAGARMLGSWEVICPDPSGYRIRGPHAPIDSYPAPGRVLAALEALALNRLILDPDAPIGFHSALVVGPNGAVLLVGRCTSGKSTLACALASRLGWLLVADDSALTVPGENGVWLALPGPRRVSVRRSSYDLLGNSWVNCARSTPSAVETDEGFLFSAYELAPSSWVREAPLRAIFLVEKLDSTLGAGGRRLLTPAEATLALAPYSYQRYRAGIGSAFRTLGPLTVGVPVHELKRGPIERMVASVEEALE